MSMPQIRSEVVMMLSQANEHIAEAEAKLAKGDDRQKVNAAGELAFLKRQKAMLDQQLNEIEAEQQASETLFQWVKEEAFNLNLRLNSWIAHG